MLVQISGFLVLLESTIQSMYDLRQFQVYAVFKGIYLRVILLWVSRWCWFVFLTPCLPVY